MPDDLTPEQHIAEAETLVAGLVGLEGINGQRDASTSIAHSLLAIAQMMAADRAVVDAEVVEDGCDAELMGCCDGLPGVVGNYVHRCAAAPGHDGLHECACGRVWSSRDHG